MKKIKLYSFSLLVALLFTSLMANAQYSGGDGTVGNPYQISTKADLNTLCTTEADWNKHFVLVNDLNIVAADYQAGGIFHNGGLGFRTIGRSYYDFMSMFPDNFPFEGSFNGNNHTIAGVVINDPFESDHVGFFGHTSNATISNLILENISITATQNERHGGMVGNANQSTFNNCSVLSGSVNGTGAIGGFAGSSFNSTFNHCSANASVNGSSSQVGGFIGNAGNTSINNCYATGSVSGTQDIGGLVGNTFFNLTPVTITNCYATGAVANVPNSGGLIGEADIFAGPTNVNNSFWDTQTTGKTTTSGGGTGRTTAQMKTLATFTAAGWDFQCKTTNGTANIWGMQEGSTYPQLSWSGLVQNCTGNASWTGADNALWSNTANWFNNTLPVAGGDVQILTGISPELNFNPLAGAINNLEVGTGMELTINTGQTITVAGEVLNNGIITVESGGALVQGTASTLAGSGNYIVRRDITAGQRFVGSPINNHSVNGIGITPSGANGAQIIPQADCNANSIDNSSPYGDILELREHATPIHNCAQSLWFVKSTGSFTNARGYAVNAAANTTLEYIGTINNGVVSYPNLGRETGSINQANGSQTRGWHLVSNPYPSPIRLTNSSLGGDWDNSVHFFDGTNFVTVQLNLNDAVIPVGQAFQIRKSAEGGNATFALTNNLREGGNPSFFAPSQLTQEHVNVTLSNNQYQSKTTVYFEQGATSEFDPQFDAIKLFGAAFHPQLYTVETSSLAERLSYNALNPLSNEPTQSVVMGAYTPSVGLHTLTFDGINTVSANVILEDKKLNTFTNISEHDNYEFVVAEGDNQDRFVLHFDANTTSANKTLDVSKVKMFPNPSSEFTTLFFSEDHDFNAINIVDFAGRQVKTAVIGNQNDTYLIDVRSLSQGVYFVQLIGEKSNEVHKLIVR